MTSVTVVSCVYGAQYSRFLPRWLESVRQLDPKPDRVIVATDDLYRTVIENARHFDLVKSECQWVYPQAWHLNEAIAMADTDWVWILDADDLAKPDALEGLEDVDADVWQMGFERSDGDIHIPPDMLNDDYLASERNVYVAGSAIRVEAFHEVDGFRDIALQDWDLWRRLASLDYVFESSGRTNFLYMRHPRTRGATELTLDRRGEHIEEMQRVA